MARPEGDRVISAEETEYIQEENIEEAGSKHGKMAELMESVQEERITRSMEEQGEEQVEQVEVVECVPGKRAGQGKYAQMSQRLKKPKQIASLVQVVERLPVDGAAVPVDSPICLSGHFRHVLMI